MLDHSGEAALAAVLGAHQLRATITDDSRYCGNWTDFDAAAERGLFHLIDEGECLIRFAAHPEPLRLGAGDLAIFPHGHEHLLCAVPEAERRDPSNPYTSMLCGEFAFATGRRNPILDALPDVIVVREADSGARFRQLAQLMIGEARQRSFGRQLVLDKLADALFVMALRHFINAHQQHRGLLAALLDPRLARALVAMHAAPGRDWTVALLAEIAHQSRTAFAEQFSRVLGVGPYQYLTEWRMAEALRLLADPKVSVAGIAERLGYQTEAAFRRAFKKVHGHGPGQTRRAARKAVSGR